MISIVQDSLRESGIDVESVDIVTNPRYDGSETVSIRFPGKPRRTWFGGDQLGVWLMSPDRGTFIRIAFIYVSGGASEWVPMMGEIVRRIRRE
ncbi:MAG: hypothetical protein OXF76_18430 [Caldilineaceae bacterium]|nr:hypothetical protein [Caldilineaceae bacterium]